MSEREAKDANGDAGRSLRTRKPVNYNEANTNEDGVVTAPNKKRQQPKRNLNETFVVKPKDKKAAARKEEIKEEEDEDDEDEDVEDTKVAGKKSKLVEKTKKEKGDTKSSTGNTLLNKTDTDYSKIDFSNDKDSASGEKWNLKISSWNVDGLRAWAKKGGMKFLEHEDPHILCLQEVKCTKDQAPPVCTPPGYHSFWTSSDRGGYAGVALLSKEKPVNVTYGIGNEEFDDEGRVITAEYENFYLVNVYVPNAGRGLVTLPKRESWDAEFRNYLKQLDSEKPVIVCGDMNVSHKEIDLSNPKSNTKNAGFTKEERENMTQLLAEGFVDSYRHLYPEETGAYTFWTYLGGARGRNVGWRLDYFLVSERIMDQVCDNVIRNSVLGSDHCPITLFFHNK